jgi:hypothetical protein
LRLLFTLVTLFLIPGSAVFAWEGILLISRSQELWLPLALGAGSGLILTIIIIRYVHIICTFEHEFTHALVALMFFRRIKKFVVTFSKGGYVEYTGKFGGKFGDMMITIAPYFLPTFTVLAVLFRPLIPDQHIFLFTAFIGFTIVFHLISEVEETVRNWKAGSQQGGKGKKDLSDIKKFGYIPAFFAIIGLTLFIFGIIFFILPSGYPGAWIFIKGSCIYSWGIYRDFTIEIFNFLKEYFT